MVAHCLFHQTPLRERARCEECGNELRHVNKHWTCPQCAVVRPIPTCLICTGVGL